MYLVLFFCPCLSVCLSISTKVISQFYTYSALRLAYHWEESVCCCWWSDPGIRIADHFPTFLTIRQFRRFIRISYTVTGPFSRNSAKWLRPTREWIHYILGTIRRTSDPDKSRNLHLNPDLGSLSVEVSCVGGGMHSECFLATL